MLCSIWAALLQLAVVLRLATKVRGGTEGGSGHREHRSQEHREHRSQGRRPMSQAEWLEGNSLWNRTGHPRAWGLELAEKGLLVKRCQESRPITSEQTGTPWEPISPQQKSRGERKQ